MVLEFFQYHILVDWLLYRIKISDATKASVLVVILQRCLAGHLSWYDDHKLYAIDFVWTLSPYFEHLVRAAFVVTLHIYSQLLEFTVHLRPGIGIRNSFAYFLYGLLALFTHLWHN